MPPDSIKKTDETRENTSILDFISKNPILTIFIIVPFILYFYIPLNYHSRLQNWWFFFWFLGENFTDFFSISHHVLGICTLILLIILIFKLKFAKYLKIIISTLILGVLSFSIFLIFVVIGKPFGTNNSDLVISKCQDFLILNNTNYGFDSHSSSVYIPRNGEMVNVGYFEDGGYVDRVMNSNDSSKGLFEKEISQINRERNLKENPKYRDVPFNRADQYPVRVNFLIASVPVSPQEIAKVKECLLPKYDSRFFGVQPTTKF